MSETTTISEALKSMAMSQGHPSKRRPESACSVRKPGPVSGDDVITSTRDGLIVARSAWDACGCAEGFVIEQIDGYDFAVRCSCNDAKAAAESLTAAGIKAKFEPFLGVRSGPSFQREAWETIGRLIAAPRGRSMVLTCLQGGGKSTMSAVVAYHLTMRGLSVRWRRWADLRSVVYESFGGNAADRFNLSRELADVDYLVIDEVKRSSPAFIEWVNDLVDARYCTNRHTMITSNLSEAELADALGARTWSRLIEKSTSMGLVCMADAYDMRQVAA